MNLNCFQMPPPELQYVPEMFPTPVMSLPSDQAYQGYTYAAAPMHIPPSVSTAPAGDFDSVSVTQNWKRANFKRDTTIMRAMRNGMRPDSRPYGAGTNRKPVSILEFLVNEMSHMGLCTLHV